jgi:hypothetical protein
MTAEPDTGWVQDGYTPHPTGGYLTVSTTSLGTEYLGPTGLRHRLDGPAWVGANGRLEYWVDGAIHRLGGPAIIDNGNERWMNDGVLDRKDGPAITLANGTREWWVNGVRHRHDGPAIYNRFVGIEEWYFDGKHHRDGGPALTYADGYQEWRVHGDLHRTDGPALVHPNGTREWHLFGRKVSEEEHAEIVACLQETGEAP